MSNDPQSQPKTAHIEDLTLWDRAGIALSALCLVHCLVLPFFILSLPLVARAYLMHPYAHFILAVAIVPLGIFTLLRGYRHHGQAWVLILGLPGLFLVGIMPILLDLFNAEAVETALVSVGSLALVAAHWQNHRACSCDHEHHRGHGHGHDHGHQVPGHRHD